MTTGTLICRNHRCNWRGPESDMLSAANPFDPSDRLYACPECKEIDSAELECEVEGCTSIASCGTPTKDMGYIHCCGKHFTEFGVIK